MKNGVSVVVPTYNEEKNIRPLILEIDKALGKQTYEIIFIDDHSTDKTVEEIKKLTKRYPIKLFVKRGQRGKTFSLLEGFEKAKYPYIAMIDADLQYPPSAIPKMLMQLEKDNADISASYRKQYNAPVRRKVKTHLSKIFNELIFEIDNDTQSGLKVFKKEILDDVKVTTENGWTFDLEFIVKSKRAGYRIANYDIVFNPRTQGKSNVRVIDQIEIVRETLKLQKTLR